MKIKFHGAAGTVTGSCYELTPDSGAPVLIDFGMFQGPEKIDSLNREPLQFDPSSLDGVVLTHAHLDHCGRLPLLVKNGFSGPVYMTPATRTLVELVLYDSARIAERNEESATPLYAVADVERLLGLVRSIPYHQSFSFRSFVCEFYDAGHILGSASVLVRDKSGKSVAFSGDLGNSPQDIEKPTEPIKSANVAILESTYGDKAHPKTDAKDALKREIQLVEKSDGALLIPAFSLERTQVLLHYIDHLKKAGEVARETPVYLDSPMGSAATDIYRKFSNLYSSTLSKHSRNDDPFDFPGLTVTENSNASKRIKNKKGVKVIIAGSGMMSGGRILNHAIDFLPRGDTRLVIVGYQAEGTIGRQLLEGTGSVQIYGKTVSVAAKVTEITSMSAHADKPKLLSWAKAVHGVKTIFLTHGEDVQRSTLADMLRKESAATEIYAPKLYEEYHV